MYVTLLCITQVIYVKNVIKASVVLVVKARFAFILALELIKRRGSTYPSLIFGWPGLKHIFPPPWW